MERFDRRRLILLAIPALLVAALVVLLASGLLVVGVGPMRINTSTAAITTGPVSVVTNHSRYLAIDSSDVTVTNHLSTPIYAWDARAFCSILTLEVLQRGAWMPSDPAVCGCPWPCAAVHCLIVRAPRLVTINPGASYL